MAATAPDLDPLSRLKRRVLGPIQERVYAPVDRFIDKLGYLPAAVLLLMTLGVSYVAVRTWNNPAEARRMLATVKFYLSARQPVLVPASEIQEIVKDLTVQTKDDISPSNRNRADGSYEAWTEAQLAMSLQQQSAFDPAEMAQWFHAQATSCGGWHQNVLDPAHLGATGWVLLAFARMGQKPTDQQLDFVLRSQHRPGWWPIFRATDDPRNASTYATALSIWALQELMARNLISPAQKQQVADAIQNGRNWLLDTAVPGKAGRWKDYPNGEYGKESTGMSGLVLHVLHRTPGPEPIANDAAWMANLPVELPTPKKESSSAQTVITNERGAYGDPTHSFAFPWLIIGTRDAYKNGTIQQRAQALRLLQQLPTQRDAIVNDLRNMPWLAAETLISLRYLEGDAVI